MPLKTEAIEEPQLNLTPMLDVVLQLIIFFMVGTRFAELEKQFQIQLPTVSESQQPLTDLPDDIVVNVQETGDVVVDNNVYTIESLESLLTEARANYPQQTVNIRGDGRGAYQNVIDVLACCHRAGIKNIVFATRVGDEGR